MQPLRAVRRQIGERQARQDVEHQEGDHALPIGRAFIDVEAAIVAVDRRHELAGRGREIGLAMAPAAALQEARHGCRQLALVERGRPVLADPAQGRGQRRQAQPIARHRRPAVRQIEPAAALAALQGRHQLRPVTGDPRRHHEAVLGGPDRRLQQLRQILAAMRRQQPAPGVDRARHGHAMHAVRRQLGHALIEQLLQPQAGRRPARAVQRDHAALRWRHQDEAVAADAGHGRLDHALHRHRRDRRVDRIAAGAQHVEGRQRRRRMRGRGHAMLGKSGRTAGALEIAHGHLLLARRAAAGAALPQVSRRLRRLSCPAPWHAACKPRIGASEHGCERRHFAKGRAWIQYIRKLA